MAPMCSSCAKVISADAASRRLQEGLSPHVRVTQLLNRLVVPIVRMEDWAWSSALARWTPIYGRPGEGVKEAGDLGERPGGDPEWASAKGAWPSAMLHSTSLHHVRVQVIPESRKPVGSERARVYRGKMTHE